MTGQSGEETREWEAGMPEAEAPPGFETGEVVDRTYRVEGVIGQGGMGSVYRVERLGYGRRLALKSCTGWRSEVGWKRFEREARIMERVDHPHVVPILAANLAHSPPYFVMPLAEGSLTDDLPRLQGNEDEALGAFRQVCLGVQAIHESGIVHRDLKPANVLRFAGGRLAVSDLGVAKLDSRDTTVLTRTAAVVGTFDYLAPEQWLPAGTREADARTDVYQLGKLLYHLLTGKSPVLIEPGALPTGLAHILQRASSVNPDDRYGDVAALLDALRYYELSKDPGKNTREALENLVLQAEHLLRRREFESANVRQILGLLMNLDRSEPWATIEHFDRLPDALLPVLASEFAGEFLPVLRGYAEAIEARVAGCAFGYADTVARRMRIVFARARDFELKTLALRTTLVAAVALNRFAAIGTFNRMLVEVKAVELALPVAEMLRQRAEEYAEVAAEVAPDRLHPAIRDLREALLTTEVAF
jgi:serine/threonine protein kinase